MSYRPQFSYWLQINPTEKHKTPKPAPEYILAKLKSSNLANVMRFQLQTNEPSITGEINPYWGTIGKTNSIRTTIQEISAKFPNYTFRLEADNEEDTSDQTIYIIIDGQIVKCRTARVIKADDIHDKMTLQAVCEYLTNTGRSGIAAELEQEFKIPPN